MANNELNEQQKIEFDAILDIVCLKYGVTKDDILGVSRKNDVKKPRRIAWLFASKLVGGINTYQLARSFNRSRSTIHTTIDDVLFEYKQYSDLRGDIDSLTTVILVALHNRRKHDPTDVSEFIFYGV